MNKRKVKCYKVFKAVNGELHSAVVYDRDIDIKYQIGKVIKPKIGKIFAFKTLEDAIRFRTFLADSRDKIFECVGILSKEQPHRIVYTYFCYREQVETFWRERMWENAGSNYTTYKPDGTIFLDKIKLIKEITFLDEKKLIKEIAKEV